MGLKIRPPVGRGVFSGVVFLLQNRKERVHSKVVVKYIEMITEE